MVRVQHGKRAGLYRFSVVDMTALSKSLYSRLFLDSMYIATAMVNSITKPDQKVDLSLKFRAARATELARA
jgi:hypothetical protein